MAVNYMARRAVKNGAKLLDVIADGWIRRINRQTLDLAHGNECICGQVFRRQAREESSGFDYVRTLFSEGEAWLKVLGFPPYADVGFFGFNAGADFDYDALQTEWIRLIDKRLAA